MVDMGDIDDDIDDEDEDVTEGLVAKQWMEEEMISTFEYSRSALRMVVAMYYESTLNSPSKSEWSGRYGTISHICDVFLIPTQKRRKTP